MSVEIEIALLVLCLLVSGFFSGSEVAVLSSSRLRIRLLAEQGNRSAQMLDKLLATPNRLLATILIGNNIANTATTALTTVLVTVVMHQVMENGASQELVVLLSTLVATIFLLVVGEITPKGVAVSFAEPFALFAARPLYWMQWILRPVVAAFTLLTVVIEKISGAKPKQDLSLTSEELHTLGTVLTTSGVLGQLQGDIFRNVVSLHAVYARDVMIPRTEVTHVPSDATRDDVMNLLREHRYTRYPVYDADKGLDEIIGVLHLKDVLALPPDSPIDVKTLAADRQPIYVPEFMKIAMLFRKLQGVRGQLAIVVDEYGGTAGMVTTEDIVEEIVGEIIEDVEPIPMRRVTDYTFICHGNARLEDLEEVMQIEFPDPGDVDTIAGYVLRKLERVPREGEVVRVDGLTLTVRDVDRQRIRKIQVTRATKPKPPTAPADPSSTGTD